MIGTPANPDRCGGNAAKSADLNLSRIECRETAFKNRAS
jgi:ribosomal protein S14